MSLQNIVLDTMGFRTSEKESSGPIVPTESPFQRERRNVLEITLTKYFIKMEIDKMVSKIDKPILCRQALLKNTIYRLQQEINEETIGNNSSMQDLPPSSRKRKAQEEVSSMTILNRPLVKHLMPHKKSKQFHCRRNCNTSVKE